MRFNPDLSELVSKEQLDADFGGDFEYEFEPTSYWEQIVTYASKAHSDLSPFTDLLAHRACKIAPDGTRVADAPLSQPNASVISPPIETLAEADAIA